MRRWNGVLGAGVLAACTPAGSDDSAGSPVAEAPPVVPEACLAEADGPLRYVMADAPAGGDGSAAAPFVELQDALDAAETGTEVRMAPGVYPHGAAATDPTRHQDLVVKACTSGTVEIDDGVVFAGRTDAALGGVRLEGVEVHGTVAAVRTQPVTLTDVDIVYDLNLGLLLEESTVRIEGTSSLSFPGGADVSSEALPAAVQARDATVTVSGRFDVVDTAPGYGWVQYRGSLVVDGALSVTCETCVDTLWLGAATTTVRGTLTVAGGEAVVGVTGGRLSVEVGGVIAVEGGDGWGFVALDGAEAEVDGQLDVAGERPEAAVQIQGAQLVVGPEGHLATDQGTNGIWAVDGAVVELGDTTLGDAAGAGLLVDGESELRIVGAVSVMGGEGARFADSPAVGVDPEGALLIEGARGVGLLLEDVDWTADGPVTVRQSGGEGVRIEESEATFGQLEVEEAVDTGLHVRSARVTVAAGAIRDTHTSVYGDAVVLEGGHLVLDGLELADNPRAGVLITEGDGTLTDLSIHGGAWSVVQSDCDAGTVGVTGLEAAGTTDPLPHLCDGAVVLEPAP